MIGKERQSPRLFKEESLAVVVASLSRRSTRIRDGGNEDRYTILCLLSLYFFLFLFFPSFFSSSFSNSPRSVSSHCPPSSHVLIGGDRSDNAAPPCRIINDDNERRWRVAEEQTLPIDGENVTGHDTPPNSLEVNSAYRKVTPRRNGRNEREHGLGLLERG